MIRVHEKLSVNNLTHIFQLNMVHHKAGVSLGNVNKALDWRGVHEISVFRHYFTWFKLQTYLSELIHRSVSQGIHFHFQHLRHIITFTIFPVNITTL